MKIFYLCVSQAVFFFLNIKFHTIYETSHIDTELYLLSWKIHTDIFDVLQLTYNLSDLQSKI